MGRRVIAGVLGVHLVVAIAHGGSHALVPVVLPPWANALVLGSVFAGPALGVALHYRGHPLGLPLFAVSMAGGLALGVALHFVVENPDHVHSLPADPWRLPFQVTAAGVALTGAVGTAVGAWYWVVGENEGASRPP